ncbi:hypothetical protein REPUB_Repub06bG0173000 [Reevesia pubescens]
MMMEGQEEVVVCKDQLQIIKGKRTRRPRPLSPLSLAMGSSTSTTSSGGESGGEGGGRNSDDYSRGFDPAAVASPTTSIDLAESNEEEEDMANCLILLAQGQTRKLPSEVPVSLGTTSKKAAGLYVHQCKTCYRCFPSFQALGGHRASHKKPKVNNNEDQNNKGLMLMKEDNHDQFNNMNTTLSLQITNKAAVLCNKSNKSKIHECSICGAEFSSGQALGGHMRRHRTLTNVAPTTTTLSVGTRISSPESEDQSKKPRTVQQWDLNLPAPEDHDHQREPKFPFAAKEKLLVFSASNLVDCYY